MGQQPNIELEATDAPRARAQPGVARSWLPTRPGDLVDSAVFHQGGLFGLVGPDAGYALKLVAAEHLHLHPGESHQDAKAAVAAIATARAVHFGRAPVAEDIWFSVAILGYGSDTGPLQRVEWVGGVAHDSAKLRALVAEVPDRIIAMSHSTITEVLRSGEWGLAQRS